MFNKQVSASTTQTAETPLVFKPLTSSKDNNAGWLLGGETSPLLLSGFGKKYCRSKLSPEDQAILSRAEDRLWSVWKSFQKEEKPSFPCFSLIHIIKYDLDLFFELQLSGERLHELVGGFDNLVKSAQTKYPDILYSVLNDLKYYSQPGTNYRKPDKPKMLDPSLEQITEKVRRYWQRYLNALKKSPDLKFDYFYLNKLEPLFFYKNIVLNNFFDNSIQGIADLFSLIKQKHPEVKYSAYSARYKVQPLAIKTFSSNGFIIFESSGCHEDEYQKELIILAQEGDAKAKDTFIRNNLALVTNFIKMKLRSGEVDGLNADELFSYGYQGLLHGLYRYNLAHNTRVSTYVRYWIKQAVESSLQTLTQLIYIPAHIRDAAATLNYVISRYRQAYGQEPSLEECCILSGFSKNTVSTLLNSYGYLCNVSSLDCPYDNAFSEAEDSLSLTILDYCPDERFTPENQLDGNYPSAFLFKALRQLQRSGILTQRLLIILILRLGLFGAPRLSLEKTGKVISRTRERVRQLQKGSIKLLKDYIHLQIESAHD